MTRHFSIKIVAFALVIGLASTATAGPFEDGVEALKRGDTATAARLLGPIAEKGDTRAQLALGVGPAVKGYKPDLPSASLSAWQIELILLAIIAAVMLITYVVKMREIRSRRARSAEFIRSLPPEVLAEAKRAGQLAKERPWEPIILKLDYSIKMMERGVRFRASGDHLGHSFSFAFMLTMSHGPVAICEWSHDGAASDRLIDILAYYADLPRGDSHFGALVRTAAIILQAEPTNVPFAQIVRLWCKIFFELTEDNPEIYLDLDFDRKIGSIREKDPMCRKNLVHAFRTRDQREEIAP